MIDEASVVREIFFFFSANAYKKNRTLFKKEKRREHVPHADAGVRRTQIDPDRWSF